MGFRPVLLLVMFLAATACGTRANPRFGDAGPDSDTDVDTDVDTDTDTGTDTDTDTDTGTGTGTGTDTGTGTGADPECGDGHLDIAIGEQCDDGNDDPGDGCSPTCRFEPVGGPDCGNARRDGIERCDDGNSANGDGCNPTCNFTNTTTLFVGTPHVQGGHDDVGPAATLGGLGALAVDGTYLWFGDINNRVLRRIEIATARVQTVAGDGIQRVVDSPHDGSRASFGTLEAIGTDGFTVWVADSQRIRAVEATPPFGVTTVAGNGTVGCGDGPPMQARDVRGLTYYDGYVWFVDTACCTIRRFDPGTGDVVTVAGSPGGVADGFGLAAQFGSPRYMASNGTEFLYVADTEGASVRIYDTETTEVTTLAGNGIRGYLDGIGRAARIDRPRGLTVDGTSVYFTEFNMHTIRQAVIATQAVTTMVGTPGARGYVEQVGSAARMDLPYTIAYDFPSRSIFFVDSANFVIRRIQ